jgi:di/tricarboxylate transporter
MSPPTVAPVAATAPVSAPPDTLKPARKWIGPLALGFGVLLIPTPSGLTATAWHYFALFAAVIAALITEPLPGAAVGFMGVTIAAAFCRSEKHLLRLRSGHSRVSLTMPYGSSLPRTCLR